MNSNLITPFDRLPTLPISLDNFFSEKNKHITSISYAREGKTPNHDPNPSPTSNKKIRKEWKTRIKRFKPIDHLIMSSSERRWLSSNTPFWTLSSSTISISLSICPRRSICLRMNMRLAVSNWRLALFWSRMNRLASWNWS